MRAPKRALAATTVVFEALVVLFAGLVARGLGASGGSGESGGSSDGGRALLVCGLLALGCLVVAGLLRSQAGYALGSLLQVGVIATGFWVPAMFFLGAVFAVLWVVALRVGARIERERAEYAARAEAPPDATRP